MKRRGILILLVMLLAACAPSASPSVHTDPAATLQVTLTSGPTCPVEQDPPDPNCAARPVADEVVSVALADGQVVASGRTDAAGKVTFALPSGEYTVTGQNTTGFMGPPEPATVVVDGLSLVHLDLVYDTGIR